MTLFREFDGVSAKQWKQKIQYELAGEDYNETLVFQTLEGIAIKPFYHKEDLKKHSYPMVLPKSWTIGHKIKVTDPKIANKEALEALSKGVESLYFHILSETIPMEILLQNIPDSSVLYISCDFATISHLKNNTNVLSRYKNSFFLNPDSLGQLAYTGNWYHNQRKDFEVLSQYNTSASPPSCYYANLAGYQHAGANCMQQLAYGMAHIHEYLHQFSKSPERFSTRPPVFEVAIGTHYLFEIAKLRALRWLWSTLAKAYQLPETCHIIAVPSTRNKTVIEAHTNSIRSSMECMSAVLGGADMVFNVPHDSLFKKNNASSNRIAWNQLLILKKEAGIDGITDVTKGSYAVEFITKQMGEKALELFKTIEKGGGFLKQLKKGTLQRKIKENAAREQSLFDDGVLKLIGINAYIDAKAGLGILLENSPFLEKKSRKTLFEPLLERRLAAPLERKILDTPTP